MQICILGATGSIGASTLEVIRANQYQLVSASAYNQVDKMHAICKKFRPKTVVMVEPQAAEQLQLQLKPKQSDIEVLSGSDALIAIAQSDAVDTVMAAIVGSAGLPSTLAAIQSDKRVLLANKESLVMAGRLFMQTYAKSNATLLPVDSEHNAIFQCLPTGYRIGDLLPDVMKVLLTGSGGPFLNTPLNALINKTPAQAIKHPNWSMGAKISVDSANMMNKGLEWIEAKWLFGLNDDQLQILIHPQSIIHSMVAYRDGSILAQMGISNMQVPIAHCLAYPKRINSGCQAVDFAQMNKLNFQTPNEQQFPALTLAKNAWDMGHGGPLILNAANEIAVAGFLTGKIKFTEIITVIEQTLIKAVCNTTDTLSDIMYADKNARSIATEHICLLSKN